MLANWVRIKELFEGKKIEEMQKYMNDSELEIFGALMHKEFDNQRIKFLKDY